MPATVFNSAPAVQQQTVLEATWTDIPDDVHEEISELWSIVEYGNDNYYFAWKSDEEWWYDGDGTETYAERWPLIGKYLEEKEVNECLIHYWW